MKTGDAKNSTTLHIASSRDPPDVVDVHNGGGDPNAQDDIGWTPLHRHIVSHQGAVGVALCVNINAEDGDHKTALHRASKDKKMTHLLVREGADLRGITTEQLCALSGTASRSRGTRSPDLHPQPHTTR